MKYPRLPHRSRWIIAIAVLVLASVAAIRLTPTHAQDTPAGALHRAWTAAEDVAAYRYRSTVHQTTTPLPTLANVGLGPTQQQLYVEGAVDRNADRMQMKLWSDDGNVIQGAGALELEVADGVARGRADGGDWEEVDDFSDFFAPGQDPLAFVRAARNVAFVDTQTVQLPGAEDAVLSRYRFDLDGPALAQLIRAGWEESLRRRGQLPVGVSLELPAQYAEMTGSGQLWVDETGLPWRLRTEFAFPPTAQGTVNAVIITDFSGWGDSRNPLLALPQPLAGLADFVHVTPQHVDGLINAALSLLVTLGAMLILLIGRRNRTVYTGAVTLLIAGMVIAPLLQSQQTRAFAADLAVRNQRLEDQRAAADLTSVALKTDWDPQRNPLEKADTATEWTPSAAPRQQTQTGDANAQLILDDGTDTDGDGISDALERANGLNPNLADSDGDGLNDGVELYELGTNPLRQDSDGDTLTDLAEVRGFVLDGRNWYLDPTVADTSGDGDIDGIGCSETNFQLTCPDTDGDNQPDVFDDDDDNDGVPDSVDISPALVVGDAQTGLADRVFAYTLDNLAADKPTFVDFQLRPLDPAHLWYSLSVLDWPGNDRTGQVQRVFDTTFYDELSPEDKAVADANGSASGLKNGDLRLVPMLEITIPFDDAVDGGNLPKIPGAPAVDASTPITAWLDSNAMQAYGVSVRPANDSGDLIAYVPLTVIREQDQNGPVAFGGRMLYQPDGALFGPSHRAQLVWLVQALTDGCKPMPEDYAPEGVAEEDRYDHWCGDNANWQSLGSTIIHTYEDDWLLTGFEVKENLGMDSALIYTDPAQVTPAANKLFDDELWRLAQGLDASFLAGRDQDNNGARDLSAHQIGGWFNESGCPAWSAAHPWGWDLANTPLKARCFSAPDITGIGDLAADQIPAILQARYTPQVNGGQQEALILIAREERFRQLSLDLANLPGVTPVNGRITANTLAVSLDPNTVKPSVVASMNWVPYQWNGVDGWDAMIAGDYAVDQLAKWQALAGLNWSDPEDVNGAALMMTASFFSRAVGTAGVVELNGVVNATPAGVTDANLQAKLAYANIAQAVYDGIANAIYSYTVGGEIKTGADWLALFNPSVGFNNTYLEKFDSVVGTELSADATWQKNAQQMSPREFVELLSRSGTDGNLTARQQQLLKTIKTASAVSVGLGVAASVTGAVSSLMAMGISIADSLGATVAKGWEYATLAIGTASAITTLASSIASTVVAVASAAKIAGQALKAAGANVAFFVVSTAVQIGLFIYTVVSSKIQFTGLEFGGAFVELLAGIMVGVIFLIIAAIPVIGPLIAAIVALIDAIITVICEALGLTEKDDDELGDGGEFARDYVCPGISGLLTMAIQYLAYGQTPLVDLENADRLNLTNFDLSLRDQGRGFSVGNVMDVALDVDTAIYPSPAPKSVFAIWYGAHFTEENLRRSSFLYELRADKNASFPDLDLDLMNDVWQVPAEDGWAADSAFVRRSAVQSAVPLTQPGTAWSPSLYLAEGYAFRVQECGTIGVVIACWLKTDTGYIYINVGENLIYDVFPATIDEFYSLEARANGAYGLDWGGFPPLADADGDGLRSRSVGGNDPDDSNPDTDGDTLSDFYEVYLGLDPLHADSDGDGLRDDEELRLGTNPLRADTDGDGLTDSEEIAGWSIVYSFDNGPQRAFVQSNPLLANADGDAYLDSEERTYGYHPNVPSTGEPLSIAGTVAEDDQYVRPGETIQYTATVQNNLRTSFAQGRLDADFDGSSVPPRAFELSPGQSQSTAGAVKVTATSSQIISLTNTAGAQIINPLTQSGGLALWFDFDEGAPPYVDRSFLNRTATCSPTCPTALTNEYRGRGLTFGNNQGLAVDAPVSELGIDGDGFTFAAYVKTSGNPNNLYPLLHFEIEPGAYQALWVTGSQLLLSYNGANVVLAQLPADWFHLTWRVEPSGVQYRHTIFVNGVETNSTLVSFPYEKAQGSQFRLGHSNVLPPVLTFASMDEAMLFHRPLSQDEIFDLAGDLVFHMNGGSTDISAYANVVQCAQDTNGNICPTTSDIGPGGKSYRVGNNADQSMFLVQGGRHLDLSNRNGQFSLAMFVFAPNGGWITGNPNQINSDQPFPALRVEDDIIALRFGQGATVCSMQANVPIIQPPTPNSDSILTVGWHHVAATFDGTLARIYIDGAEIGNQNCAAARPGATSSFHLGGYDPNERAAPVGMNYSGWFDDARVYNYALTPDDLRRVINLVLPTLDLRLDEPPARESFTDHSDNPTPGTCVLADESCPFSGLPGRVNQGVQFDGVNDVIRTATLGQLGMTGGSFTAAAWVKVPTNALHPVFSAGQLALELVNDGGLKPRFTMPGANALTGPVLQPNRWHHIVWRYTYATTAADRKIEIFVDGAKHAAAVTNVPALTATTETLLLGQSGSAYFRGMLDDVKLYSIALTDAQIVNLHKRAPVLNLHLDAPAGDFAVTNDAVPWLDGECSFPGCPQTGVKGKVYRGFAFDGVDDKVTVPNTLNSVGLTNFSVGLWFKPMARKGGWQTLVVKERNDREYRNYGLFIGPNSMNLHYSVHLCGNPNQKIDGIGGEVFENRWNHAMLTYDGKEAVIYVNGFRADSKAAVGAACAGVGDFLLGSSLVSPAGSGLGGTRSFAGEMDEVVLYPLALSAGEVADLFRYQQNWFDTEVATPITVDAVAPTVSFDIGAPILARRSVLLAGTANDDLGGVANFLYRVRPPGSGASVPFSRATQDGNSWIFPFAPTVDGQHRIEIFVEDAAGNFTSASDTVQIDGTGPILSGVNVDGQPVVPVQQNLVNDNWIVDLQGGVMAEGSPLDTVTVQFIDANGTPVSDPLVAPVSNNIWQTSYPFGVRPNGIYTLIIRATDQVGNVTVRTAIANIDGTPPRGEIGSESLYLRSGAVITGSAVDTGDVHSGVAAVAIGFEPTTWDEQSAAHWLDDGLLLHLPLDENTTIAAARAAGFSLEEVVSERAAPIAVAQRSYRAQGPMAQDASCRGSACPVDGVRGALANSLRFDGVDDTLTVPWLAIYDPLADFSAGVWVNVGGSGRQPILTLPANGAPLWSLVYDGDSGKIVLEQGGQSATSNVSLTPGVWQHVLFTVTGGTNATLYVDGDVAASFTVPAAALPVGTTLRLGSDGASFFAGGLDDLVLYDRVLSAAEVARHARGYRAVLHLPLDGYRFVDGGIVPETSRYQHETRLHLVNRSTINTFFGFVGSGALGLGAGEYISVPPSPVFDLSAGEFTQAAWILIPDIAQAGVTYPIIGGDLTDPAQSYPSLGVSGDGRVTVSFGDGTNLRSFTTDPLIGKSQPTFLAASFDGTTYRIYVNGAAAASTDLFAGSRPTATTSFDIARQRGPVERWYTGGLDEVQIYRQALSADDIAALYAHGWQFAALASPPVDNLTWTYTVPVTLDGGYTIRLVTADGQGNTSFGGDGNDTWQGAISPNDPTSTVDLYADDDGDGLVNGQEDLNGNGDPRDDDTDGDGTPDYKDPDDDGDGVPTATECPAGFPCPDTDGDGTPDYKDNDDDGDGVPTAEELGDSNGNGVPDYLESSKETEHKRYLPLINR